MDCRILIRFAVVESRSTLSRYGVGYILSDASIGVYFNDSTKIILAAGLKGAAKRVSVLCSPCYRCYPTLSSKSSLILFAWLGSKRRLLWLHYVGVSAVASICPEDSGKFFLPISAFITVAWRVNPRRRTPERAEERNTYSWENYPEAPELVTSPDSWVCLHSLSWPRNLQ